MTANLLAISNHGDMIGGGEHSFLDLVSNLPAQWKPLAAVPAKGELLRSLEPLEGPTTVLPLPPIRPQFLPLIISSIRRIVQVCRTQGIELVYANGSRAAVYGGIAARLLGKKMIWHCRVADRDPRLDLLLQILCFRIIVNSRATAGRFPATIHPKIRIIHNGIDIERFSRADIQRPNQIPPLWKNILVVARVSRWKRHDLALTAFEGIAPEFPETHLFFVGDKDPNDPEWWNALQTRTRQSPVSDRIHWVGRARDVRPWYASAYLMILPSKNEPFGRVVIEAMASGVPVIADNSGGPSEIITHGTDGFLFSTGNADQLVDYTRILLSDVEMRDRIVHMAQCRARDFGLERHVQRVSNVFDETLL